MKPLAIDLFCGLFQAEFLLGAYASVEQLVARRAKYPDHMPLRVTGQPPCAVTLKLWAMRDFENAGFAARLACFRHPWISTPKAVDSDIFVLSFRLVGWPANLVFSPRPCLAKISRGLNGTQIGAISPIGVGWLYRKMRAAAGTIATAIRCAFVFRPTNSACAPGAIAAAPFLIWSDSMEWRGTLPTKQIIHTVGISA